MVVDEEAGREAHTSYRVLERLQGATLAEARLHTGRTHQIRVHMAHIGHPLVADALYGGAAAAGLQRQALHAFRLAFEHPVTGSALEFHAPLPADLRDALRAWGLRYNDPKA